jgi:glycosyltransferase involved in cell wall biosynthesis
LKTNAAERTAQAIHLTGYLRSLGGMQAVVQHHLAQDFAAGIDARYVVFFEGRGPEPDRVEARGWNWRWTIRRMRRDFRDVMGRWPDRTVIYHNLWGLPFLADLDGARRRIGYLHSNTPGLADDCRAQRGGVDGLIAVSQNQAEIAGQCLPELGRERIRVVPVPICPPDRPYLHPPFEKRALVLGYSGRLVREIKRIDRLPELARELSAQGLEYRLELLGEGRDAAWLKGRFASGAPIVFHGSKSGAAYWEALAGWDAQVNVSDSEGTPLSLLEGLSIGVIPLFPNLASGGVAYSQKVDPSLVYPPGDMAAAARTIGALARMPAREWDDWRSRCQVAVRGHLGTAYLDAFRTFIEQIERLPRLSRAAGGRRSFFATDYVPLGFLARLAPQGLLKSQ